MKPINYTIHENGNVTYHYKFSDLRKFLEHGFREGNNGCIIVGEDADFTKYRGFGTIENPNTSLFTIEMQHDPIMDGKRPHPSKVIENMHLPDMSKESRSIMIWDASK